MEIVVTQLSYKCTYVKLTFIVTFSKDMILQKVPSNTERAPSFATAKQRRDLKFAIKIHTSIEFNVPLLGKKAHKNHVSVKRAIARYESCEESK